MRIGRKTGEVLINNCELFEQIAEARLLPPKRNKIFVQARKQVRDSRVLVMQSVLSVCCVSAMQVQKLKVINSYECFHFVWLHYSG